jgi:hypothetical protein
VLAPPLQVAELMLRGAGKWRLPAPIPPSLLRLWKKTVQVDARKAQRLLHLKMTPLDDAVQHTARWFNQDSGLRLQR